MPAGPAYSPWASVAGARRVGQRNRHRPDQRDLRGLAGRRADAAVLVTPNSGLHTTEAGGTSTFTVRLATVPARNVVVPLASSNQAEGLVSPLR